jgi:hypothetical protein
MSLLFNWPVQALLSLLVCVVFFELLLLLLLLFATPSALFCTACLLSLLL